MATRFSKPLLMLIGLVALVTGATVAPGVAYGIGSGGETKTSVWFGPPPQIIDGARLIDSGRVQEGMALMREALQENLDLYIAAMAYTNLCAGNLHLKLYEDAIKSCDTALAMRSSQWQALNNRGGARYGMGDYDSAIADYIAALFYQPGNVDIATNLEMARRSKRSAMPPEGSQR
jgi:tetratricopeptide (TPR) repeat protein